MTLVMKSLFTKPV